MPDALGICLALPPQGSKIPPLQWDPPHLSHKGEFKLGYQ